MRFVTNAAETHAAETSARRMGSREDARREGWRAPRTGPSVTTVVEPRPRRSAATSASRSRGVVRWMAFAAAALGLWVLLVGGASTGELFVGGLVAVAAASGASIVASADRVRLRFRARDVLLAWQVPGAMVTETWRVFVVLARHLFTGVQARSLVHEQPLPQGGDEARAAARRALAAACASATPSCVVLGFDEERGVVLYHMLEPGPVPPPIATLRGER